MNSGRTVKRVHFQAGIVGENKEILDFGFRGLDFGNPARQFDGFPGCIACEGVGVFHDLWRIGKVIQSEKSLACDLDQSFSCFCQRNALAPSLREFDAEELFKLLDLATELALAVWVTASGSRDATRFSKIHERPEPVE